MWKYIASRSLLAIPTLVAVTAIIFIVMRILPGDVLAVMFGEDGGQRIRESDRQVLIKSLNLDKPLYKQYGAWLKDIVTLDLGQSFWRGTKVSEIIWRRGIITAEMAVLAIVISWLIGLPVGILAAVKQNSISDYTARFFTIFFVAMPNFWLGALIALFFLLVFDYKAPPTVIHPWDDFVANMEIVVWPSIVLGLGAAAYVARITRSALLEVIREDYVRTARAKGLAEHVVILKHALRNALLPVVTLSGVFMGYLLGGSVAVEQAFGVPGLGTALVLAFNERDYIMTQNLVLLYGFVFVVLNLLTDLTYAWIDPRIRYA